MRPLLVLVGLLIWPSPMWAGNAPEEMWVRIWNGPGNHDDWPSLVALDPTGPVYVAGSTYEPGLGGNREDFALLRYDLGGNLNWFRRYGGDGVDEVSALLVPEPGRVAVTGFSSWDGTAYDVATLVYNDAGDVVWEQRFPLDQEPFSNFPPRMARDESGNLLISAHTDRINGDYLVLKYSSGGTLLWNRTYDAPQGGQDLSTDIAVDGDGSVYVTGIVGSNSAFGTIKFDASGVFQWEQFESGDIGSVFEYAGLEVGPDGDVVVVGNPESTCGLFQVGIWKCSAATGEVLWSHSFPPNPCHTIEPEDMAVDAEGNVYVTGFGYLATADFHFQTLKYDADGNFVWHRSYDGPGTSSDMAAALALDASGGVYAAGLTTFPPQNRDFAAVKYSTDGQEEWSIHWPGPFGTNDGAADVAVSEAGDVFLTGHSYDPAQQQNVVTIRYRQQDPAGAPFPGAPTKELSLRVTENPCSDGTSVRYHLTEGEMVRLAVHDSRGRLVRHLRSGFETAGAYEVHWSVDDDEARRLPSGMYFIRLESQRGAGEAVRIAVIR